MPDFDPSSCANKLEILAGVAPNFAGADLELAPEYQIVKAAAELLCGAKTWLRSRTGQVEPFPGAPVLRAVETDTPVAVTTFVNALRDTAAELEVSQGAFRPIRK